MPDPPCPYRTLGVPRHAPLAVVRAAFCAAARAHHPDRGGDAAAFSAVRAAYDTLSDPAARAAHEAALLERAGARAAAAAARARRGRAAAGGEDVLLASLRAVNPATQLVTTCTVCGRPATFDCAACGLPVCDFCSRERHAAPRARPHWPVRASSHLEDALAERQLEAKRVADAAAADAAVPGARTAPALAAVRRFRDAVGTGDPAARDAALAPLWAWAQTDTHVFVAVAVPPGEPDAPPKVAISADGRLRVGAPGFPPTLDTHTSRALAADAPARVLASADGRIALLTLTKAPPYGPWKALRAGDGDAYRCVDPPYRVCERDDAVELEFSLPGWVQAEDVSVRFDEGGVRVRVAGVLELRRSFWAPAARAAAIEDASWSMSGAAPPSAGRVLTVTLPRVVEKRAAAGGPAAPPPPKHNAHEPRPWGGPLGIAYFTEDDDPHGLADALAAAVVAAGGAARVRAPPGGGDGGGDRWVADAAGLPLGARRHLEAMMAAEEEEGEGG